MRKDDPCIGVCQWDGRTGWCLGCGRTVPEIRAWRKMTAVQEGRPRSRIAASDKAGRHGADRSRAWQVLKPLVDRRVRTAERGHRKPIAT
ncbi:DUF1289 domain-containing protein [Methylobacterium radiotolerans]|uniref:DUF1289 domain-containing protein n=1 Tax=Methylobacterium radiotolerans TaxID=31998 RepID=UPI0033938FCD